MARSTQHVLPARGRRADSDGYARRLVNSYPDINSDARGLMEPLPRKRRSAR